MSLSQRRDLLDDFKSNKRILDAAGFGQESEETDLAHAKKLKRLLCMAEKHGGLDQLQNLLNFQDKRVKQEYQAMLAGLCITAGDVVAVSFLRPKPYIVFGLVLPDPDMDAPYEVNIQLCGSSLRERALALSRKCMYETLTKSNVERLMEKVLSRSNVKVVYEVTQCVGDSTDVDSFYHAYIKSNVGTLLKQRFCKAFRKQVAEWAGEEPAGGPAEEAEGGSEDGSDGSEDVQEGARVPRVAERVD